MGKFPLAVMFLFAFFIPGKKIKFNKDIGFWTAIFFVLVFMENWYTCEVVNYFITRLRYITVVK